MFRSAVTTRASAHASTSTALPNRGATTPALVDAAPTRGFDLANVPIQRKPALSSPGDAFEREADAVADRVMRMAEPGAIGSGAPSIQRKCSACADEDKKIHTKQVPTAHAGTQIDTRAAAHTASHGGVPLAPAARAFFEPRFGHDFSHVRVHADAEAASAARSVRARAYTLGNDIVFGAGQYSPSSASGRHLLAHELTHVVQQEGTGSRGGETIARYAEEEAVMLELENEPLVMTGEQQPMPDGSPGSPYQDRGAHTNWKGAFEYRAKYLEGRARTARLERPMTVLFPGGDPPDFITEGRTSRSADKDNSVVEYTPYYFHVLDAVEYWVDNAPRDDLLPVLYKFVFADLYTKPDPYRLYDFRTGSPMMPFDIGDVDPKGTQRRIAFKRGLAKRNKRKPKPSAEPKPAPKIPDDVDLLPDSAQRRKGRDPCEPHLELPEGKRVHYARYKSDIMGYRLAGAPTSIVNRLRTSAYERDSNQVKNWFDALDPKKTSRMDAKLVERGTQMLAEDAKCGKDKECIEKQRKRVLKPDWAPDGTKQQMDVDHIIELQVGYDLPPEQLDSFDNYELLDSSTNSSVGSTLDKSLQNERARLKRECPKQVPNWDEVPLHFRLPIFPGGGKGPGKRWSRKQIMAGEHLDAYPRKSKAK